MSTGTLERGKRKARFDDPLAGGGIARLRRHPHLFAAVALAIAAGTVVAIAASVGFARFGSILSGVSGGWVVLAAVAQLVGVLAYASAYRVVASTDVGAKLPYRWALRLVAAGFGAFTVGGGFALDYHALKAAGHGRRGARVRVLGLGAVEYAVLAPAASIAAIVLLASGGGGAMPSLLWPWALAVPAGFGAALLAAAKRDRLTRGGERRRLNDLLLAIDVLRKLARSPRGCAEAFAGMAFYWAAELVSLWAALAAFGKQISVAALLVAYATGYAATRRTLPLGGAGATEALMTYSLHWAGLDVAHALAAVLVYRLFNFIAVTPPALRARASVVPLFRGEDASHPRRLFERLVA